MNRNANTLTTAATLALAAGSLFAETGGYPACIASSHERELHTIAELMFNQIPAEHQAQIALKGGIGSAGFDLQAFDSRADAELPEGIEPDLTAHEYLDLIVSDELSARLSQNQWNILNSIADTLDSGKQVPHLCFAPGTDPEYAYAINQLIEYPLQFRFQQTNRWTRTAVDGSGLSQGDPTTITYSFVPDGTFVPNLGLGLGSGNSVLFQWLDSRYNGDTQFWQGLFHQVFDRWAELTGLDYIFEPNDDGATTNSAVGFVGVRGDVRIAAYNFANDGNGGVLAYNNFPNDGDMVFDAFDSFFNSTGGNSLRLRNVAAHEHGHGLGMLHVCPANGTKLMEPFIDLGFDGPQLDDILNGHRHYGDPTEPNENLNTAIDLGDVDAPAFISRDNLSIDDNSDIDIMRLNITERSALTIAIGPQAGTIRTGPQTQFCNSGTLVDYNAIQDLEIELFSATDLLTPVATENTQGAGGIDTLVYDVEEPGVFYAIISAASNVNNVQRYQATVFTAELPPLACPADLNGDETLDFFDISIFIAAFNNNEPDGDFDNNGEWNFFDVSGFISAFNAGCP